MAKQSKKPLVLEDGQSEAVLILQARVVAGEVELSCRTVGNERALAFKLVENLATSLATKFQSPDPAPKPKPKGGPK